MNRYRDKRAAVVLALLLVLVFVFGQARRADADRHTGADPAVEGDLMAGGANSASCALHD
jgi:hypothetical protein